MERVVSKHLFNYPLDGVLDSDAETMDNMMKGAMQIDPELNEWSQLHGSDDPEIDPICSAKMMRKLLGQMQENMEISTVEATSKCKHTEIKVPLREGNDYEVPVLVHTPVRLVPCDNNAAIIYAHGGGCVAGSAQMFRGSMSQLAIETGVVVFNVDYRLAPETKCPKNILDFYCAIKHIKENAKELRVDPEKIAISGESGGGYICWGAMVMLAQRDEGDLVKLAIPSIPMTSDYCFSDRESMTKEEKEGAAGMQKIWRLIADDFETQRTDPLLFPGKASDELIEKMPPTIVWEMEFDFFITDATRMARRLRNAGRLLELRIQPGMTHISAWMPGTKGFKDNMRDWQKAVEEYLL